MCAHPTPPKTEVGPEIPLLSRADKQEGESKKPAGTRKGTSPLRETSPDPPGNHEENSVVERHVDNRDHEDKKETASDISSNPRKSPSDHLSLPNGTAFSNSKSSLDSAARRRIMVEEVAPSHSSIIGSGNKDWMVSLDLFTTKKRGKSKEDRKLPKNIRRFYKEQDELISAFEEIQLDLDDAMENTEEMAKRRKQAEIAAKITFFINLLLLIGKGVAAGLSGSLSIISAVIDSGVDLISGLIMWWSNRAIKKQRDPYTYPQGRTKLEPIGIIVLSVIMSLASIQMIREAIARIIEYANDPSLKPDVTIPTIVICCSTVAIKLALWLYIRRIINSSAQALAQDQRNDILSNTAALAGAFIGDRYWSFADPVGAIIICVYIIASWIVTGKEQIQLLTGHTARPDFLKKITWIAVNHHPKVSYVDTVRVYHFGNNFLVECDIVLPEDMKLKKAHDIGESLQHKIEKLPEVERAFVHLDYEWEHHPLSEHKQVWQFKRKESE